MYFSARVVILEQPDPVYNSLGSVSMRQKIQYVVHVEDSGKRLICKVTQVDSFGKEVVVTHESLLTIKAKPPAEPSQGLNVGIIGVIVACAAFVILALILLILAYRSGRFCFKRPEKPPPDEIEKVMFLTVFLNNGNLCE